MAAAGVAALALHTLAIPFREAFRHGAAERDETSSVWVTARAGGLTGYGESCPRPYVTGETLDTARAFFAEHEAGLRAAVVDLETLGAWMAAHGPPIDANPAAWCAIELALLDVVAKQAGHPVEALLGLPRLDGRFRYTAVLGDAPDEAFRAAGERYRRFGFTDFKVKLSGDLARDRGKCAWLRSLDGVGTRARADVNNVWRSAPEAIQYLRALDYPFFALEEPIGRGQFADMARISDALRCPVILDESVARAEQIAALATAPHNWIVNVRVSKMGGLLRSLAVVAAARDARVRLVVGAQVGETSVLTRAALPVAAAAGDLLLAQEGAFGTHLLVRDVCEPALMFGAGGVLDVAQHPVLALPGLGVTHAPDARGFPEGRPDAD